MFPGDHALGPGGWSGGHCHGGAWSLLHARGLGALSKPTKEPAALSYCQRPESFPFLGDSVN